MLSTLMRYARPARPESSPCLRFRRITLSLAVAGTLAVPALAPSTAAAAGHACAGGLTLDSCVTVDGSGPYVAQVQAGVQDPADSQITGRFHIWGDGLNWYSGEYVFKARWWSFQTFYSPFVRINRDVPAGPIYAGWEYLVHTNPDRYGPPVHYASVVVTYSYPDPITLPTAGPVSCPDPENPNEVLKVAALADYTSPTQVVWEKIAIDDATPNKTTPTNSDVQVQLVSPTGAVLDSGHGTIAGHLYTPNWTAPVGSYLRMQVHYPGADNAQPGSCNLKNITASPL